MRNACIHITGLTNSEVREIAKNLGLPIIVKDISSRTTIVQDRLDVLKDQIIARTNKTQDGKIKLEFLYRWVNRKGYGYCRRTFSRDIQCLEEEGFIKREVYKGGNLGSTTLLSINNESNPCRGDAR